MAYGNRFRDVHLVFSYLPFHRNESAPRNPIRLRRKKRALSIQFLFISRKFPFLAIHPNSRRESLAFSRVEKLMPFERESEVST